MALLDTQVAVLGNQALNWMASGEAPRRMGNGHLNLVPYQAFKVADGEMIVAVGNDRQFERLCEILGLDELAADERFRTNPAGSSIAINLIPLLQARIAEARRAGVLRRRSRRPASRPGRSTRSTPSSPTRRWSTAACGSISAAFPGLASPIVIDGKRQVAERRSPELDADRELVLGG